MTDDRFVPIHVAFIMDGNGRWAQHRGLPRKEGHKKGIDALERMLSCIFSYGVKIVTVFAFSTENWSRPKEEVDGIISLLDSYMKTAADFLVKNQIKLNIMGEIDVLPQSTQDAIKNVLKKTEGFTQKKFNIAFNYSGRAEIIRAANLILKSGKDSITEQDFKDYLYTAGQPDPDLIIRTSGEERLSNFMLYQAAYSELYFTKTLWPDISKRTIEAALNAYKKRVRKFGGIK